MMRAVKDFSPLQYSMCGLSSFDGPCLCLLFPAPKPSAACAFFLPACSFFFRGGISRISFRLLRLGVFFYTTRLPMAFLLSFRSSFFSVVDKRKKQIFFCWLCARTMAMFGVNCFFFKAQRLWRVRWNCD